MVTHVYKCSKCVQIKNFQQNKLHTWPKNKQFLAHVDDAYVNNFGLCLILVCSFSEWPEIVHDKRTDTVRQLQYYPEMESQK